MNDMTIQQIHNFSIIHNVQIGIRFGDYSHELRVDMYRGAIGCSTMLSVKEIELSKVPTIHMALGRMYLSIESTIKCKDISDQFIKKYGG